MMGQVDMSDVAEAGFVGVLVEDSNMQHGL